MRKDKQKREGVKTGALGVPAVLALGSYFFICSMRMTVETFS